MRCRRAATPPRPAVGIAPAGERFALGAGMSLDWTPATGRGLGRSRLPSQVTIQQRAGGERFREAGTPHSRPLRKWLQERGVVPWQRAAIPLVMVGEQVAAVGHIAVASDFAAAPDEPSWQLEWTRRPMPSNRSSLPATFEVAVTPPDPLDCPPVVQFLRRWLP